MKINVVNLPLYKALVKLGLNDEEAGAAAQYEIVDLARLATSETLHSVSIQISDLRTDLRLSLADLRRS